MINQIVTHYKILEHLGGGGMGVVYKAEDTLLKRTVALKFLPPDLTRDPEAKERFMHEAQAASALQHNNICSIHEIGESSDGQFFIVMDLYEGDTLKSRIAKGELRIEDAVDLTTQIAQGLQKAHEKGIVHRDIKPANVLVTADGIAKIVDFGLAKLSGRTLLTKSGTRMGTAAYMSPEQARGEQVDNRSDIWSLGVVFYEMLTGKRPFESDYEQAMVYSILNEEPKPAGAIRSDVPTEIETILKRALAKNPDERYQNTGEMLADLKAWSGGGTIGQGSRRWSRKKRKQAWVTAAVVVVVAVAAVLLIMPKGVSVGKLAIMPIMDRTKDTTMTYLYDGMTEDMINSISQLARDTKVVSFTGVEPYKTRGVTPTKAGEELGADVIVICRSIRQDNQYTVTLEVNKASDNTLLGTDRFSVNQADILSVPRTAVASIMRILGLTAEEDIAASISNRQTKNVDAYRLYIKGNSHYHKWWSEADLRLSLDYYRKALDKDPDYALAHGGLALSYIQLAVTGAASFKQIKDSALVEAQKALALDDKLPEAHLALTELKYCNFESAASIEEGSKRTIQLNPSYADAIHFYAHWLSETRKPERAIEMMVRSVEYEPLNPHFQNCVGIVYGQARRWVESQAAFKRLFEMDSAYFSGSSDTFLHNYAVVRGDTAAVIMYRKKFMTQYPADSLGHLAFINEYIGRISIAQEYMRKFDLVAKSNAANADWKASMSAVAKNKQETVRWLEAMYENRDGIFQWVNTDPAYDFLIGDPRFEALMKKAGYRD